MALRVYILGDAATYQNYALAVERAGGISCFESRPADCDCLLLPGGGDMESWRYGQKNTAGPGSGAGTGRAGTGSAGGFYGPWQAGPGYMPGNAEHQCVFRRRSGAGLPGAQRHRRR